MTASTAPALGEADGPRDAWPALRARALRDPGRIALTDGVESLSYADLVERVVSVSAAARAALGQPEADTYLPVLVDRSVGSAVALLACRLGRVPHATIDVTADPDYLATLHARVGTPGVFLDLTRARTGSIAGARPIAVPAVPAQVTPGPLPDLPADLPSDDEDGLVIFTSGSTGVPKGVVLSWGALEQRWRFRRRLFGQFGDDLRQAVVAPLDSLWALTLMTDVAFGSALLIIDVTRLRPAEVLAQLADFAPTDMAIPSQLARILSQLPERSIVRLPSVRRLGIGSEGFRYEYVAGLLSIFEPDVVVGHNLATTEAGRIMHNEFALGEAPASGVMHVGTPVFPDHLRLVPTESPTDDDDEVFEVYVGGAIATRYLHNPELTEQRFSQDSDGTRWWRSGDVVGVDANGQYRHRGRIDDIVKVRGKLASPGDVTAVLLSIDGIRAAITVPVVVSGNTRLESHVEVEPDSMLTLDKVREVLSARLPAHLMPSAVMRHAALPITARGKVDRHALADGPFQPWGNDA